MRALLGDACLAGSLEAALAANGQTVGMRIVTPTGETVGPDGGITGGTARQAGGLIWRKAEIERMSGIEEEIKAKSAGYEAPGGPRSPRR